MNQSLDLFLLPICRQNNRNMDHLPGLFATQTPRRAGRGRSGETLMIHLFLEGTAPLTNKGYSKLLAFLVELYFQTSGSSTTAMRTVVSWLNEYLLERNRRGAERDMSASGLLTLVVLRGNRLNLAQCGSTHAYIINSSGLTHLYDEAMTDRGLGLGQTANVRNHLLDLSPDDAVVIAPDPPPIWTKTTLIGLRGLTLKAAYERLVARIGPDLQAAIIQIKSGSGELNFLKPRISVSDQDKGGRDSQPRPVPVPGSRVKQSEKKVTALEAISPQLPATPAQQTEITPDQAQPQDPAISKDIGVDVIATQKKFDTSKPSDHMVRPKRSEKRSKSKPVREPFVGSALLKIGKAIVETLKQGGHVIGQMVKRMLPDESIPSMSTTTMAFIALAVPILVVAVAAMVYFTRGRSSLFDQHYIEAQEAAEAAIEISDPDAVRDAWSIVLSHLDQAEDYRVTEESQALRSYAQAVLDDLDLVIRLSFQPAMANPLPPDAEIKRIVVAEGDSVIYLLNKTDGRVFRGTLTDQGFVLNDDFICEPVPTPLIVGPLVDILPLPLDSEEMATLIGMDGNGNLLKCIPGGSAPLAFQMPPPDMHWGTPLAFESTALGLYVLDPVTNAVWIFWNNDEFGERPTFFFDEQVPPMRDVMDLTLNREELYLLHEDGHLTTCVFGYPTRCEDPAMMTDLRVGGSVSPNIDGVIFQEIQLTSPPDSSIFLLEPTIPSVFRFTLRLNYHIQYRPKEPLPGGQVTAFAVSPGHQIFLAVGNQVYVAPLP